MGAQQSLQGSPASLSPAPTSSMCEYSKQQREKFIKEIDQLNISRDEKIGLQPDFKKQLKDANDALKRIPQTNNDIEFVANVGEFDEKNALLEDAKILEYPLIVKYILCCEVAHILTAYNTVLKKIVELCNKCQSERGVESVDQDVDNIMVIFEEANRCFVLFSQEYKKGDIGDEYGSNLFYTLVDSTKTMQDMFKNKEEVKSKMREVCKNRKNLEESRAVLFTKGAGGNRSRSNSKFKSKKQKLSRKKKQKIKKGQKR